MDTRAHVPVKPTINGHRLGRVVAFLATVSVTVAPRDCRSSRLRPVTDTGKQPRPSLAAGMWPHLRRFSITSMLSVPVSMMSHGQWPVTNLIISTSILKTESNHTSLVIPIWPCYTPGHSVNIWHNNRCWMLIYMHYWTPLSWSIFTSQTTRLKLKLKQHHL
jgi:hypothetical protein